MNESSLLRPLSPLPAGVSNVQHESAITLSTPVKPHHEKNKTPNTPTSDEMDLAQWCDDFGATNATGEEDDCRDENNEDISSSSMRLSPIQHGVNLDRTMLAAAASSSAPSSGMVSIAAADDQRMASPVSTPQEDDDDMNSSFPENEDDVEIRTPSTPDQQQQEEEQQGGGEETEEERIQRELEESEALARQMMAEEAMATYAMSIESLRQNADQFSEEDLAALQAAMAEEDPEEDIGEANVGESGDNSHEMSYDALLRLGERIGDVKEERWACEAQDKIDKIPTLFFDPSMAEGKEKEHTEVKCLICQENYEQGEELRRLPCQHCFHKECVDTWLSTKDRCAFCRKSIISE